MPKPTPTIDRAKRCAAAPADVRKPRAVRYVAPQPSCGTGVSPVHGHAAGSLHGRDAHATGTCRPTDSCLLNPESCPGAEVAS